MRLTRIRLLVSRMGVLALGTASAQAAGIMAAPVITRLYLPEDLGAYGQFLAVIGILLPIVTLKLELAILSQEKETQAASVYSTAMRIVPVLAVLALYAVFVVSTKTLIVDLSLIWEDPAATFLLFGSLACSGWYLLSRCFLLRRKRERPVAVAVLGQGVGRVGGQTLFGTFGLASATGLYLGELLGRSISVVTLLRHAKVPLAEEGTKAGRVKWGRYWKYPAYATPSHLIDAIAVQAPVILILGTLGSAAAGAFTLMQRVVAMPMSLVGLAVADVVHGSVAGQSDSKSDRTRTLYWTTLGLAGVGFLPAAVLVLFGEVLIPFIFGGAWTEAGRIAAPMGIWMLAQFICAPIARFLYVMNVPEKKLPFDFVTATANIGLPLIGAIHGWSLVRLIWALSAVNAAAYLFLGLTVWTVVRRAK